MIDRFLRLGWPLSIKKPQASLHRLQFIIETANHLRLAQLINFERVKCVSLTNQKGYCGVVVGEVVEEVE